MSVIQLICGGLIILVDVRFRGNGLWYSNVCGDRDFLSSLCKLWMFELSSLNLILKWFAVQDLILLMLV